ncbi:lipopolysaccharide biosynthesis protein RfbH, partial [bacterium]|nr:lipopolysaccharide biosynthesis protein RfbH [bacterium]
VPVFVDIEIPTYNIDVRYLKEALSEKSKAIMIAHTLGNPFDVETVSNFAKEHDLWLIEDTCDALGSTYKGKLAGTYGDLATLSFYPAHHLTMGEGGCVLMNSPTLKKLVESFRDWGRDCWCEPGKDNTCGKRFCWKMGELPEGYDHKYIYSHIGYNLKLTDMQAAIGLAQLTKVSDFIQKRKDNFSFLCAGLRELEEYLILPEATQHSDPSWFGFPISIRESAPFCRNDVVAYLNNKQIATRLLFGGNLIKQPAYRNIQHRIIGELRNCDFVMNQCFWIGVYPGLTREMLEFVIETFREGLRSNFRI